MAGKPDGKGEQDEEAGKEEQVLQVLAGGTEAQRPGSHAGQHQGRKEPGPNARAPAGNHGRLAGSGQVERPVRPRADPEEDHAGEESKEDAERPRDGG